MKNWRIICWLFLISFSFQAKSQDLRYLTDSAIKLIELHQPYQAYSLLRRIQFYSGNNNNNPYLLQAAYEAGKYEESYLLSKKMLMSEQYSDSIHLLEIFARSAMNSGHYHEFSLDDNYGFESNRSLNEMYLQFVLLATMRQYQWEKSVHITDTLYQLGIISRQKQERLQFQLQELIKIQPQKIAKRSLIIPGWGQLMLGDYRNATHAFLLNSGLVGGMIVSSIIHHPIDGVLFWITPLTHYYLGNANAAKELADMRIAKLESDLERILMDEKL